MFSYLSQYRRLTVFLLATFLYSWPDSGLPAPTGPENEPQKHLFSRLKNLPGPSHRSLISLQAYVYEDFIKNESSTWVVGVWKNAKPGHPVRYQNVTYVNVDKESGYPESVRTYYLDNNALKRTPPAANGKPDELLDTDQPETKAPKPEIGTVLEHIAIPMLDPGVKPKGTILSSFTVEGGYLGKQAERTILSVLWNEETGQTLILHFGDEFNTISSVSHPECFCLTAIPLQKNDTEALNNEKQKSKERNHKQDIL